MDVAPCITREIEVDFGPDELWSLLADGTRWSEWLVDEGAPDVRPGGGGTVVDDGERRHVRVDTVVEGERVVFEWWHGDATDDATGQGRTQVELEILRRGDRTGLRVTETPRTSANAQTASSATSPTTEHGARWDVRLLVLHLTTSALART